VVTQEELLTRRYDSREPGEKPSFWRRLLVVARIPMARATEDRQLSPHFRLAEFHCRDGTAVPQEALPALLRLCAETLEPLRERFGVCTVVSGYRHAAYNSRVGGARFSQHIYDLHPSSVAADLVFDAGQPGEWAEAAEPLCELGGLGRYPSFIHVDNRGTRARW
jgi:hypothetical protein